MSHRSRGAWIEINKKGFPRRGTPSHRSRGAWIEITDSALTVHKLESHRSRGAWIEIGNAKTEEKHWVRRIAHAVRGLK